MLYVYIHVCIYVYISMFIEMSNFPNFHVLIIEMNRLFLTDMFYFVYLLIHIQFSAMYVVRLLKRIRLVQQAARDFLACRRARILVLSMMWDYVEGYYIMVNFIFIIHLHTHSFNFFFRLFCCVYCEGYVIPGNFSTIFMIMYHY
jgi:hypothetical protein